MSRIKDALDSMGTSTKLWCQSLVEQNRDPLGLAWNVCSFLSVLVPLVTYWICHARFSNQENGSQDNDNNDGNASSWWWWSGGNNQNGNDDENQDQDNDNNGGGWWWQFWNANGEGQEAQRDENQQPTGALVFCYLWTLVMFLMIVHHGHKHLMAAGTGTGTGTTRNLSFFLLLLVMFANLSFMAAILTACISALSMDERQREGEQGGGVLGSWLGTFCSCMVLTYALWTFLCAIFAALLYTPRNDKEFESSSSYSTARANDYQRHDYYNKDTTTAGAESTWSMWSGARPVKTQEDTRAPAPAAGSSNFTTSLTSLWAGNDEDKMVTPAASSQDAVKGGEPNNNDAAGSGSASWLPPGVLWGVSNEDDITGNNNSKKKNKPGHVDDDEEGPMSPLECFGAPSNEDNENQSNSVPGQQRQRGFMA